jgi:phage-related tail fiber protein
MNGVQSAGSLATVAKADHVHPSDTSRLPVNNPTVTGTLTLAQDPVNPLEAATKQYVDNYALGLDFKQSVVVTTTASITLSGTQTIDTVALTGGERVLVKNQGTASQNGIYIVSAGAWTRSTDADTNAEVTTGMFVFVEKGSLAGTSWVLTTQGAITVGSTGLTFTQFGGGSSYTAGTGIDITGNTISLAAAGFSASYLTSGTLNDARLSSNVMLITTTVDGGTF